MTLLLGLVFCAAGLSLLSYLYCWHDIQSGAPHIISLRQVTSIMDRERLNRLFGAPEPGYIYKLNPQRLKSFVRRHRYYIWRECAADLICMVGAWRYLAGDADPQGLPLFLLLATLCQGINILWSLYLVRKWAHQIKEELDDR